MAQTTSFTTTKLNETTFLIIEDDNFGELPYIYLKLHPKRPLCILTDSGCQNPREKSLEITKLKNYIEHHPNPANGGHPLNPSRPSQNGHCVPLRSYAVVCSHCHYDHIGGIADFADEADNGHAETAIVASGYDPDFVKHDLETHSLWRFQYKNKSLPRYSVTSWVLDGQSLYASDLGIHAGLEKTDAANVTWYFSDPCGEPSAVIEDLGVMFIQTPGHTPDSLAWFDKDERWLFVGDSFYERGEEDMPIIFPKEGNLITYLESMNKLLRLVQAENGKYDAKGDQTLSRVKVACGHQTARSDAEHMLLDVLSLFRAIVAGDVLVVESSKERGEWRDLYKVQDAHARLARFSVLVPRRLIEEARAAGSGLKRVSFRSSLAG